jgi:Peptidase family M1 domain
MKRVFIQKVTKVLSALTLLGFINLGGMNLWCMQATGQAQASTSSAVALYRDLLNPSFDVKDVYQIREVSILLEDLHISISDGTLAFMREVNGQITGAVFEGVGEVLLVPPNRAEKTSLALFTGSAVLEKRFQSAYLRFSDSTVVEALQAGLRGHPDEAQEFITRWQEPATALARGDALLILQSMTSTKEAAARFVHLRMGGTSSGIVDVFFDTNVAEQISVAQANVINDAAFYDIWTSFPMRSVREAAGEEDPATRANYEMSDYVLRVKVQPPTDLSAEAEFTLTPHNSGKRTVVLEFSRYLKLAEVRVNGEPAEFIQNEAINGSDLARRGDDLIGVVLPTAMKKDRPVKLSFKYSGPVMFSAGGELLYVGARGTWYPNVGPSFSNFDLTFECPGDWQVVGTGRQVSSTMRDGKRITHFITEKPIGRAGFNMGKFVAASSASGQVNIHAYGARNVEQSLANTEARAGRKPDPTRETQQIADQAANTVQFLSAELAPFPYSNLEITQLPGMLSQSWPGLIYLSSTAFLSPDERRALGVHDPYVELLLSRLMLSHETAHQWWGDAVDWVSYRDEWIVEALANYSALVMLEKQHPGDMKTALNYYRNELLRETKSGIIAEAGPVTLGRRLTSSKFPDAYERVLYGRGTWLIHMLRTMLHEADLREGHEGNGDAVFFAALQGLLAKAPNHKVSTLDLQRAFEQVMPASLGYESKKSLEWFFDSWINGNSIPQFTLDSVHLSPGTGKQAGKLKVTGTILETHAAQDMVTAVPLYAVDATGKSRFLAFVFADDTKTDFTLTAPADTKLILLDPEETLLRR